MIIDIALTRAQHIIRIIIGRSWHKKMSHRIKLDKEIFIGLVYEYYPCDDTTFSIIVQLYAINLVPI